MQGTIKMNAKIGSSVEYFNGTRLNAKWLNEDTLWWDFKPFAKEATQLFKSYNFS